MRAINRWITKTLRAGERRSGTYVTIHALSAKAPRLAVIVSKKISGKAVMRNRTKRVIVETVRPMLLRRSPRQLVIVAKRPLPPGLPSQAVRNELLQLL